MVWRETTQKITEISNNNSFKFRLSEILRAAVSGNEDSIESRMFELLRSRNVRWIVRNWWRNALHGIQWKPPFICTRRHVLFGKPHYILLHIHFIYKITINICTRFSVRHLVVRFELWLGHQLPISLCQRSKTRTLDPRELLIIYRRSSYLCLKMFKYFPRVISFASSKPNW